MDIATLAMVVVVVGISAITYRTIEEPGRRVFARLANRGGSAQLVPRAS
jgi:peptidoglycan/LPS O-acetylase OafA/YrhL